MKAKEKAIELISDFIPYARYFEEGNKFSENSESAKQCALICVDEKMKLLESIHDNIRGKIFRAKYEELLSEKNEIQKL